MSISKELPDLQLESNLIAMDEFRKNLLQNGLVSRQDIYNLKSRGFVTNKSPKFWTTRPSSQGCKVAMEDVNSSLVYVGYKGLCDRVQWINNRLDMTMTAIDAVKTHGVPDILNKLKLKTTLGIKDNEVAGYVDKSITLSIVNSVDKRFRNRVQFKRAYSWMEDNYSLAMTCIFKDTLSLNVKSIADNIIRQLLSAEKTMRNIIEYYAAESRTGYVPELPDFILDSAKWQFEQYTKYSRLADMPVGSEFLDTLNVRPIDYFQDVVTAYADILVGLRDDASVNTDDIKHRFKELNLLPADIVYMATAMKSIAEFVNGVYYSVCILQHWVKLYDDVSCIQKCIINDIRYYIRNYS